MAKKGTKEKLTNDVWSKEDYYQLARKGSFDVSHPGMKILKRLSKKPKNILDMGCGEGTRLNYLVGGGKNGAGVDISSTAIKKAKKRYPGLSFIKADLEAIPFNNNSFDLVYSAFVLEHLTNPEKVIGEAIRVTRKKGKVVFIAPNYGSPNRCSPPYKSSRIIKFIRGLINDFERLVVGIKKPNWNKVRPLTESEEYQVDYDVVIEPYLGTIIDYLKRSGLEIIMHSSCWEEELPGAKLHQRLFRFLGERGIYPFKYWGPHFVVVGRKSI